MGLLVVIVVEEVGIVIEVGIRTFSVEEGAGGEGQQLGYTASLEDGFLGCGGRAARAFGTDALSTSSG